MTRHTETIEIITRDKRRRRWSPAEKAALVRRTYEPGMSVSLVARQKDLAASLLFTWRRLEREGALVADRSGNRGAGLLAGCQQFALELRGIGAARAWHRVARRLRVFGKAPANTR
nr:transposase [Pantoea sp. 18069]